MKRYLFLMRHAEAEQESAGGDIGRVLTPRGLQSIGFIGDKLRARGESVQRLFSSTAIRAGQTARGICPFVGYAERDIVWRQELYLASPGDLLAFLCTCPAECTSLMLVGHNPGLQGLRAFLAAAEGLPPDGSMSTAAVAKLEFETEWRNLQPECARLVYLLKPWK